MSQEVTLEIRKESEGTGRKGVKEKGGWMDGQKPLHHGKILIILYASWLCHRDE